MDVLNADILAERILIARAGLDELEKATRRLFESIKFGDEAWPGEARAISAQHELALVGLGEAAVRLSALQSMTTVKSTL